MNIISNDCTGGTIYKELLKDEYKNPFIWSRIFAENFLCLVKNYEKINFNNVDIFKRSKDFEIKNDFYLKIDNLFEVNYRHYFYSNDEAVIKKDPNIFYNKIWEFILDKYNLRIKRMNETPIFFINEREDFNKPILEEIISICKHKYKLFIWTNYLNETKDEKLIILNHNLNIDSPWEYIKRDKEFIYEFIK